MSDNNLMLSILKAMGDHPDVQQAVVKYINAETAKVKAPDTWKEVYREITDDERIYIVENDRLTGIARKETACRCLMLVHYCAEYHVTKIAGYYWAGVLYDGLPIHDFNRLAPFYEVAYVADKYTQAITQGGLEWETIVAVFKKTTEPKKGN